MKKPKYGDSSLLSIGPEYKTCHCILIWNDCGIEVFTLQKILLETVVDATQNYKWIWHVTNMKILKITRTVDKRKLWFFIAVN